MEDSVLTSSVVIALLRLILQVEREKETERRGEEGGRREKGGDREERRGKGRGKGEEDGREEKEKRGEVSNCLVFMTRSSCCRYTMRQGRGHNGARANTRREGGGEAEARTLKKQNPLLLI